MLQAKVQDLTTQVQQLQQAVDCLELEKKRSAAQVQALDEYLACKQQLAQPADETAASRKVRGSSRCR